MYVKCKHITHKHMSFKTQIICFLSLASNQHILQHNNPSVSFFILTNSLSISLGVPTLSEGKKNDTETNSFAPCVKLIGFVLMFSALFWYCNQIIHSFSLYVHMEILNECEIYLFFYHSRNDKYIEINNVVGLHVRFVTMIKYFSFEVYKWLWILGWICMTWHIQFRKSFFLVLFHISFPLLLLIFLLFKILFFFSFSAEIFVSVCSNFMCDPIDMSWMR